MPRFRIQSNLHLDGFQMLDACLENVTSFEGLSDKNTGRIVFLNGSSSNKSNLHPAVFYGNEFKGLAYLDDIDKITNGEGSLGTRVKALEDMLGLQDVTNVIDTWNDVQEFFKNVDEGLNLMTMLNGKAEWNQDISSDSFKAIGYGYGTNGWRFNGSALSFGANSTYYAQLQIHALADQIVFRRHTTEGFTDWKEILHAGNVGDYALKIDGSNKMEAPLKLFSGDISTVNYHGLFVGTANIRDGAAFNYGAFISIPDSHVSQLQLLWYRSYHSPQLAIRLHESNTWGDWKTIAFTDSDITGNAATATKLKDTVSLWGNEFDGTQSLSNSLILDNNKQLRIKDSAGVSCSVVGLGSDNNLLIGGDLTSGTRVYNMYLDGYKIYFRTGAKQTAMTITDGGNIEIAGANNAYTRKLAVGVGGAHIIATTTGLPSLGTPSTHSLLVGSVHYGLQIGTNTNDEASFIQAQRFNSADAKTLILNPRGGAVNVGEGGLNVKGGIVMSGGSVLDKISATSTLNIVSEQGQIYISSNIETDFTTAKGNMFFNGETFTPWTQNNNAISLGRSEARWSDVYSVNGNFSGRVLIGGAEDDADYALITKGNWKLTSTDKGDYFSIKLRDVNVDYYGYDAADSWCNHNFISNGTTRFFVAGRDAEWSYIKGKFRTYGEFRAEELATFNGGALIPTGQKLTIGDANGDHATIEYDSIAKAIKVDGNLYTTGTNASGGKADAQQGGTGGNAEVHEYEFLAGQSTYTELNPKGSRNVIVQIYEWNANDNTWDMILTDVSVTNENIIVTFGRDTTVNHLMTVV